MDFLVLDTIHGGLEIGHALAGSGHHADMVDVYRGVETPVLKPDYDYIVTPVHLKPDHPLLKRFSHVPKMSHHDAVRWILGTRVPEQMVEITGARGKTTTAFAVAHILPGRGVLHTSGGTFLYPEKDLIFRRSITPASLLPAVDAALSAGGWLVAEVSLGVTGAGNLAVLTSVEDYRCAGGTRSALDIKLRSVSRVQRLLLPTGMKNPRNNGIVTSDIARVRGELCTYQYGEISGSFCNPLLSLDGYRNPLATATAAGCILGVDPAAMGTFAAIPGRMELVTESGRYLIDNSNSGSTRQTTIDAARYARKVTNSDEIVLVIGQEAHAVCEGFPVAEILATVETLRPSWLVLVGREYRKEYMASSLTGLLQEERVLFRDTLAEGRSAALSTPGSAGIVLAVKTWR